VLGAVTLVLVSAPAGRTMAYTAIGCSYDVSAHARSDVQIADVWTGDVAQVGAGAGSLIAEPSIAAGTGTTPSDVDVATKAVTYSSTRRSSCSRGSSGQVISA
jgi:hypothetical protein